MLPFHGKYFIADIVIIFSSVVLCKTAAFPVNGYTHRTTHGLGALFICSGAECEISHSNFLTSLTGARKSHMAARFLYTYTDI